MYLAKALSIIVVCSGFIEAREFVKCDVEDTPCHRIMYQDMYQQFAAGIPEWGLPNIENIYLKDITVFVGDLMEITVLEATGTGAKDCAFVEYTGSIRENVGKLYTICKLNVAGKFKLSSSNPLIQHTFGVDSISTVGEGVLELGDLHLILDFVYYPVRNPEDHQVYFKTEYWKINHTYEFTGKSKFYFNSGISFNSNRIANDYLINTINEHVKYIETGIGDIIIKTIVDFYVIFCKQFYSVVPVSNFLTGDITPYVHDL